MSPNPVVKYKKEYETFVKKITDEYISMVTGELLIQYFDGSMSDGPGRIPTNKEQKDYFIERNKIALNWLVENFVDYNKWCEKFK